jgi:hypothetical protein
MCKRGEAESVVIFAGGNTFGRAAPLVGQSHPPSHATEVTRCYSPLLHPMGVTATTSPSHLTGATANTPLPSH